MKALVVTIGLFCLPMPSIAQKVVIELKITAIVAPKDPVKARFDGSVLTLTKGEQKPLLVPLAAKKVENIRKAILAVPTKQWNGFWASVAPGLLDGCMLVASLEIDGKKFVFSGMNGFPPKFSKLLQAIYEASKEPLFEGRWEDDEKSSKRFESFDAYIDFVAKSAKEIED
jgi:hypothetical protein